MQTLIEDFLQHLRHERGQAEHTQRTYAALLGRFVAWAGKQGLDQAKFKELYNSFSISSKARRAVQLQDAYKVQGVPALGVAGRFYTDGTIAGNIDRALQVTEYLVAEVRKSR